MDKKATQISREEFLAKMDVFYENEFKNTMGKKLIWRCIDMPSKHNLSVKIAGVGNSGNNILNQIKQWSGLEGEDKQAEESASNNIDSIKEAVKGADVQFVIAGLGGMQGANVAPIIAECANEAGALTIGVVTMPFTFEGRRRNRVSKYTICKLQEKVDVLIIINNDDILEVMDRKNKISITDAFRFTDKVLCQYISHLFEAIDALPSVNDFDIYSAKNILENASLRDITVEIGNRIECVTFNAKSCEWVFGHSNVRYEKIDFPPEIIVCKFPHTEAELNERPWMRREK